MENLKIVPFRPIRPTHQIAGCDALATYQKTL
jgi:hypothetical protein